jgi:hypothetical protein
MQPLSPTFHAMRLIQFTGVGDGATTGTSHGAQVDMWF